MKDEAWNYAFNSTKKKLKIIEKRITLWAMVSSDVLIGIHPIHSSNHISRTAYIK